jgi:hypothetical protein
MSPKSWDFTPVSGGGAPGVKPATFGYELNVSHRWAAEESPPLIGFPAV